MPDFAVVPQPTSLGNTCAFCSTHKHERGFVNLMRDEFGYGRLHACAGCADQIGRAVGGIDPQQAHTLHGIVDELTETCERLGSELAAEKVDKVVPLAEVDDHYKKTFSLVAEVAEALKNGKIVFMEEERAKRRPKPTDNPFISASEYADATAPKPKPKPKPKASA